MWKLTFTEHGVTEGTNSSSKGFHGAICSLKERKLTCMHETKISLFMLTEDMACRDELDWLIRCYHCAFNNYPEEYCPPRPLTIPSNYQNKLCRKTEMTAKGTLPPPLKVILKTYYPLAGEQQPPAPPPLDIPPSPLQLSSAEPESLGDDQIESEEKSFKALVQV